jgi:hypothetical protein
MASLKAMWAKQKRSRLALIEKWEEKLPVMVAGPINAQLSAALSSLRKTTQLIRFLMKPELAP